MNKRTGFVARTAFIIFVYIISACSPYNTTQNTATPLKTITTSTMKTEVETPPSPEVALTVEVPVASETAEKIVLLPTNISTPEVTPTLELKPTLSANESKEEIRNLIKTNGNCNLPCFWGISPGETKIDNTENVLRYLGFRIYDFSLESNVTSREVARDLNWPDKKILIDVSFMSQNNIIQYIQSSLVFNNDSSLGSNFSLSQTYKDLGKPSRVKVFVDKFPGGNIEKTNYYLWVYYDELGTLMRFENGQATKSGDGYQICPRKDEQISKINNKYISVLTLKPPQADVSFEDILKIQGMLVPQMTNFQDATGESIDKLFQSFTTDSQDCFIANS